MKKHVFFTAMMFLSVSSFAGESKESFEAEKNLKSFEEHSSQYIRGEKAPSIDGVIAGLKVATDAMKELNKGGKFFTSEEDHFAAFDILRDAVAVLGAEKIRHMELSDVVAAYSAELALMNPVSPAVGQILVSARNIPAIGIFKSVNALQDQKKKDLLLHMIKIAEVESKNGNG